MPKFPPTPEQVEFIDAVGKGGPVKGIAFAGAGKTASLVMTAEGPLARKKVLMVCFNKANRIEADGRMPANVKNKTWHQLAWPTATRLNFNGRKAFGAMGQVTSYADEPSLAPVAQLFEGNSRRAALAAVQTLTKFSHSADPKVLPQHLPGPVGSKIRDKAAREQARAAAAEAIGKLWATIIRPESKLLMTFDHFLKAWALSNPVLPFDTILLDEAQDTNPVTLAIMMRQHELGKQVVFVGDSHQQIYAFRGAIDAMKQVPGIERHLTTSFRFGPEIAGWANAVLGILGERHPLIGGGAPGEVLEDDGDFRAQAVLCRGNAGVLREAIAALDAGKRVAVVGGTAEAVKLLTAAYELFSAGKTGHPELGLFENWTEFSDHSETDEGGAFRPIVKTVSEYADGIPNLCRRLEVECVDEQQRHDIVISTAHKAKGREWDEVRLAGDFPRLVSPPDGPGEEASLNREEGNLLYVSITRARKRLNIGDLGERIRDDATLLWERGGGQRVTVPGRQADKPEQPAFTPEPEAAPEPTDPRDRIAALLDEARALLDGALDSGHVDDEVFGTTEAAIDIAHQAISMRPEAPAKVLDPAPASVAGIPEVELPREEAS